MSFTCIGGPADMQGIELDGCDLIAKKNIYIPPLCPATIPHGMRIESADLDRLVMVISKPGVFQSRSLITISSPVYSGYEICTDVFNISNSRILIRRGESISRLVSLVKG